MPSRSITPTEFKQLSILGFGDRLRFIRKLVTDLYEGSQQFSTTELAKQLDVKAQTLTAIERNEILNPSYKVMSGLSRILGLPLEAFDSSYYNSGKVKLFTIGHTDYDSNTEPSAETYTVGDLAIPSHKSHFNLSISLTQTFEDGSTRNLYQRSTKSQVNVPATIQLLTRLITELDLLEQQDLQYSMIDLNNYNRALSHYIHQCQTDK